VKKKGVNTVLILVVIGLYSVVAYRFFGGAKTETVLVMDDASQGMAQSASMSQQTFGLTPLARDPFLAGSYVAPKPKAKVNANPTPKQTTQNPVQVQKPLVNMKYKGVVKNLENARTLILVSFNGNSVRMSQGDVHDGYKLEKIYKDSCLMSSGKEKYMVKK